MATRYTQFALGEFYHVYNRGTEKRVIFESESDYQRFQDLLFLCNTSTAINARDVYRDLSTVYAYERGELLVAIGAYCQMPNHFHLLLTPLVESGVGKFLGKLCTSYSMYFNKKYERSGRLFESSFRARHVASDEYLKYLFSYIHLNPVKLIQSDWRERGVQDKEKVLNYLKNFKYSSYVDNSVVRPESKIINREHFPEYFTGKEGYDNEMEEWLSYGADDELSKN